VIILSHLHRTAAQRAVQAPCRDWEASLIVLYALIGLVVGGVINILADVLPHRRKPVRGPLCPACDQPRPTIQALATIAYLTGKRTCPSCGRSIAVRNVIVELGTAALFAFLYTYYPVSDLLSLIKLALASFHVSALILVTVTDLEHRRIPNRAIVPAMVIAALTSWLWFWHEYWYVAFIGGAIGYAFFWLAAVIGGRFIGRGAMGGGDVKLAAYVGFITGFPGIIVALIVTILAGGLISFALLLIRIVNLRSGIPYGPFIVIGGIVTMIWGPQILGRFFGG
jgi:leader peptidase (prepilin peptidase)/N-methyltransferase